ncbi:MAG TPA: hypothetical protein VF916_09945 [Ktedonobacterales bacterium]
MSARDLAKWLIRPYVQRGDSMESLRLGSMGFAGTQGDVHIHLDHIFVERLGPWNTGTPCNVRFRLADVYAEVQSECRTGVIQGSLFDGGAA